MPSSGRRSRTFALGVWLASRAPLARTALALAAVGAVGSFSVVAFKASSPSSHMPTLVSMALAWSIGVSIAFGGALRALQRDFDEGIIALARARGVPVMAYAQGRVWGLAALIAGTLGCATLAAGVAATWLSTDRMAGAREAAAALVYALAFAATLGPLSMATLGASSRLGGYLAFVVVLGLPEMMRPWTGALLPQGWHELTSIPSALAAVAAGVRSGGSSLWHMARALAALAAVVAASQAVVWARLMRMQGGA
jgi:hypothetical protein